MKPALSRITTPKNCCLFLQNPACIYTRPTRFCLCCCFFYCTPSRFLSMVGNLWAPPTKFSQKLRLLTPLQKTPLTYREFTGVSLYVCLIRKSDGSDFLLQGYRIRWIGRFRGQYNESVSLQQASLHLLAQLKLHEGELLPWTERLERTTYNVNKDGVKGPRERLVKPTRMVCSHHWLISASYFSLPYIIAVYADLKQKEREKTVCIRILLLGVKTADIRVSGIRNGWHFRQIDAGFSIR